MRMRPRRSPDQRCEQRGGARRMEQHRARRSLDRPSRQALDRRRRRRPARGDRDRRVGRARYGRGRRDGRRAAMPSAAIIASSAAPSRRAGADIGEAGRVAPLRRCARRPRSRAGRGMASSRRRRGAPHWRWSASPRRSRAGSGGVQASGRTVNSGATTGSRPERPRPRRRLVGARLRPQDQNLRQSSPARTDGMGLNIARRAGLAICSNMSAGSSGVLQLLA